MTKNQPDVFAEFYKSNATTHRFAVFNSGLAPASTIQITVLDGSTALNERALRFVLVGKVLAHTQHIEQVVGLLTGTPRSIQVHLAWTDDEGAHYERELRLGWRNERDCLQAARLTA